MPPIAVEHIPSEAIRTKAAEPLLTTANEADQRKDPSSNSPAAYKVLEQPSRTGRKLRVIAIGAGASALNFAHDVDTSALDVELVCYEKNAEIGGTWFENRYSTAPEILGYFKKVAADYGLLKYVRLSHRVVGATWCEEDQQWRVRVQRGEDPGDVVEDKAHVLVNASGVLNAAWDDGIDLAGKRVAVIGGGSSAVQIVPNIQPVVSSLTCFIRSTSWVTAGFGQRYAGKDGANFNYTEEQKEVLRNDPEKYLTYRKTIESELNSRFKFIINGSKEQADARAFAEKEMRRKLQAKPEIGDMIVPTDFAVGCRRPTPGNGYLESLCEDNVTVVPQSIDEITEKGIRTADGVEHEFDVIVCATGFDVSWRPKYPTIGRGGRSLSEEWRDIPSTYLSISVPHFPNYLIFNGPFGPYGHGSFLPITEVLSKHFIQMLTKMSMEYLTSFEPKEEAVADFAEHRRTFLPRTAWTSPCRSWFKQGTVDGEVMMWPGSRTHFFETMKAPRWEDYVLNYADRNRFYYLGNGFAAREVDGRDITWYLGLLDGKDVQPAFSDSDIQLFMTS
ncbi:putative flavin-binding monooxygenase [Diplodia seriata]|uniref:Putative flavin-binding monooxygenase n=1 Tax=Diplodia seriata TaxID=420778 RepID=A0A0G2EYT3_9PEZI|nr:putative flavin-binding monooxygenase [Diplodia seriata]